MAKRRTSRPLIVGEAPSRSGGPPIVGRIGRRLAAYAGLPMARFLTTFARTNVFAAWPGALGKGSAWNAAQARQEALRLQRRFLAGRTVVLLGKRVGKAFGAVPAYFTAQRMGRAVVFVVPHPSGVNRWFNDAANRARLRRFMSRIAKKSDVSTQARLPCVFGSLPTSKKSKSSQPAPNYAPRAKTPYRREISRKS